MDNIQRLCFIKINVKRSKEQRNVLDTCTYYTGEVHI